MKAALIAQLADAQEDVDEATAEMNASIESWGNWNAAMEYMQSSLDTLTQALAANAEAMANLDPESSTYAEDVLVLVTFAANISTNIANLIDDMNTAYQTGADLEATYQACASALSSAVDDKLGIQAEIDSIQQQIDSNNQEIETLEDQIEALENM